MIVVRMVVICLIGMISFSCKKDVAASSVAEISSGVNTTVLMNLVNEQRSKGCSCGGKKMPPVPPLIWNKNLEKAAYDHSVDMSTNNYFDHIGLNGSNPGTRISAAGYNWISCAENIAEGFTDEQSVINAWLISPGHCKNLMGAQYTEMGVGRSGKYWTMTVGRSQ